jgi:hypothetical protein
MTQITIPRRRAGRLAVALAASAALCVVLCAALANTASAAIPDLTRVSASSVTDSFLGKSATASCPARTGLIGTAARISGGDGQVVLEGVRPNVQQRTVTVTAHEDHDGTTANWSVTATAICANIPGIELVTASINPNNPNDYDNSPGLTDPKYRYAWCPAGKKLVGAGAEITGAAWGRVVLDEMSTNTALLGAAIKAEEQTPMPNSDWSLTAYAICADPPPGLEFSGAGTSLNSIAAKLATASCPSDKKLLGATGSIYPGGYYAIGVQDAAGKVGMVQLGPLNPLTQSVTVIAQEDQSATTGDWTAGAGAICASP